MQTCPVFWNCSPGDGWEGQEHTYWENNTLVGDGKIPLMELDSSKGFKVSRTCLNNGSFGQIQNRQILYRQSHQKCTVALGAFYAVQRCSLSILVSLTGRCGWFSWERGNWGLGCHLDIMNGPYDLSRGLQKHEICCFWLGSHENMGFPGGSAGKESACNAGDPSSIPGLGTSLEEEMATHSSVLA